MSAHLIIAADVIPVEGPAIPAPDVFDLMMKHSCWEFPETAPHLDRISPGDQLVFYLGGNLAKYMAGEAVAADEFQELTSRSSVTFDRKRVPFFRWRLPLRDIQCYSGRGAGLDTIMKLAFMKLAFAREKEVDRPYVGLLLRVGLRPLTPDDVELIRKESSSTR